MIFALKMMPSDLALLQRVRRQIPLPSNAIFHPINRIITRIGAWGLTPQKALKQYDAAHNNVLKILETISENEFDLMLEYPDWDPRLSGEVTVERLFHYPKEHFYEHVEQIRSAIKLPDRNKHIR